MTNSSAFLPGIRREGGRRIVSQNLLGRLTGNCCVHVSLPSRPQQRRGWILTTFATGYSENNETPFRLRRAFEVLGAAPSTSASSTMSASGPSSGIPTTTTTTGTSAIIQEHRRLFNRQMVCKSFLNN